MTKKKTILVDHYGNPVDVKTFVEKMLDGYHYYDNQGAIETVESLSNNTRDAFARLIEMLHQHGVLGEASIYYIATGQSPDNESQED